MKKLLLIPLVVFSFSIYAQKNNLVIQQGTKTKINNHNTPKQTNNKTVAKLANKGKVQSNEFKQNGSSFFVSLENVTVEKAIQNIKKNFTLSTEHSFVLTREIIDELGITHYSFAQYYKDVKANERMILLHGKNGLISTACPSYQF